MTTLTGLGLEIQNKMIGNLQNKVLESMLEAASKGKTTCEVSSKGLTFEFLNQLENEGVQHIKDLETITFFWELEV